MNHLVFLALYAFLGSVAGLLTEAIVNPGSAIQLAAAAIFLMVIGAAFAGLAFLYYDEPAR